MVLLNIFIHFLYTSLFYEIFTSSLLFLICSCFNSLLRLSAVNESSTLHPGFPFALLDSAQCTFPQHTFHKYNDGHARITTLFIEKYWFFSRRLILFAAVSTIPSSLKSMIPPFSGICFLVGSICRKEGRKENKFDWVWLQFGIFLTASHSVMWSDD